jgi:hypothetical protein
MYDDTTEAERSLSRRPDDLRRGVVEPAIGGTLSTISNVRDEVDRLEVTIERLVGRLEPVLTPPSPMTSGDGSAKSIDEHSELTGQLNGIAHRIASNNERLQYLIDRIDL